jgi:beta-glucosidase
MFAKHPDFRAPNPATEARIADIVRRMTIEEKIAMLGGARDRKAIGGDTVPCPRVGIPSFKMADASVGIHWWCEDSTTFPASIALAAAFDTDLAYRYGAAVGRECRARGIHILLGPGVNLYRSPLCGRNFEYLGEDPCLAARMVAAYVRGLQDQGVAATVKHYALNFQEYDRHRVSSDADERTLREIYLPAFEAAVREGGAAAIMTAYNPVNGVHCSEHPHLLRDILRGEWGFDGLVMSDWVSVYDAVHTATFGVDLEMPVAKWLTAERLLPAIRNGLVSESAIDDKIRRLLRVAFAFGWMDREQQDRGIPLHDETSAATALEVARESIVLLANDGILPADPALYRRIAVIGPCGHPAAVSGGGSAYNKPWRSVSVYEGMRAVAPNAEVTFVGGVAPWRSKQTFEQSVFVTPDGQPGIRMEIFANEALAGTPVVTRTEPRIAGNFSAESLPPTVNPRHISVRYSGSIVASESGEHSLRIECWHGALRLSVDGQCLLDSWNAELMGDREIVTTLSAGPHALTIEYHAMRERSFLKAGYDPLSAVRAEFPQALDAARHADLVVFCGGHTNQSEGESRDRMFAMHPEIERLLLAVVEANPNTVLVLTGGGNIDMRAWHDKPRAILHAWYPGQEGGTAVAEVLTGRIDPCGRLPATFEHRLEDRSSFSCYHDEDEDRRVAMSDGVFVGHRHFDRNGTVPRYPFGYGLSYTTFAFENLTVQPSPSAECSADVCFDIVNTGARAGKAVAQVYVGENNPRVPRPVKELKGFVKILVAPGERKRVTVPLNRQAFAFYDSGVSAWTVTPGLFTIHVAASAADVRLSEKVRIGA